LADRTPGRPVARAPHPGDTYPAIRAGLDTIRALRVPQLWMFAADDVAPSAPSIERLATIRRDGAPIRTSVLPGTTHGSLRIATNADGSRRTLDAYGPGHFQLLTDLSKGATRAAYGDAPWVDVP
jgi:hypothetical protein